MTEPSTARYAYCVVPTGEAPGLEVPAAIDPAFGLELVSSGELSAVTSCVRLEEFGTEALKCNLEDLAWVERVARAHDAVVRQALVAGAVVPLRLCTIFADEASVRAMLGRERAPLLDALRRLRGREEWSVKMLADPQALRAMVRERDTVASGAGADTAGRAFFARKKVERTVHEESRALAQAAAEDAYARLREHAAAAVALPPQSRELSRRSGEMVLNAAYLVDRDHAAEFAALAERLGDRARGTAIELELSGPWAPYNFVTAEEGGRRE
jgi:hypothetical protein